MAIINLYIKIDLFCTTNNVQYHRICFLMSPDYNIVVSHVCKWHVYVAGESHGYKSHNDSPTINLDIKIDLLLSCMTICWYIISTCNWNPAKLHNVGQSSAGVENRPHDQEVVGMPGFVFMYPWMHDNCHQIHNNHLNWLQNVRKNKETHVSCMLFLFL
jgi:hypothetical protein